MGAIKRGRHAQPSCQTCPLVCLDYGSRADFKSAAMTIGLDHPEFGILTIPTALPLSYPRMKFWGGGWDLNPRTSVISGSADLDGFILSETEGHNNKFGHQC